MHADRPHYRTYGYCAEGSSFEWTKAVEGPDDIRMIEQAREWIAPDPESTSESFRWADLFYCHDRDVTLVGTWVVAPGRGDEQRPTWHAGGWPDRPRPSKEKALRYLHELDRPI